MGGATGAMVLAVLAALVGVGGCGAPTEAERGEIVALPGLALRMEVPGEVEVVERGGRVQVTLRPATRRPLWIEIARAAGPPEPGVDRREGALEYRLELSDAGNGGEQMRLIGRVDVGGGSYDVSCVEESEERMTLDWCFQALATLRTL